MDEMDIRNHILDEIINQMEDSLAEKHYPSEKPKEDAPMAETKEAEPTTDAPIVADEEMALSDEEMAALEGMQGE